LTGLRALHLHLRCRTCRSRSTLRSAFAQSLQMTTFCGRLPSLCLSTNPVFSAN